MQETITRDASATLGERERLTVHSPELQKAMTTRMMKKMINKVIRTMMEKTANKVKATTKATTMKQALVTAPLYLTSCKPSMLFRTFLTTVMNSKAELSTKSILSLTTSRKNLANSMI